MSIIDNNEGKTVYVRQYLLLHGTEGGRFVSHFRLAAPLRGQSSQPRDNLAALRLPFLLTIHPGTKLTSLSPDKSSEGEYGLISFCTATSVRAVFANRRRFLLGLRNHSKICPSRIWLTPKRPSRRKAIRCALRRHRKCGSTSDGLRETRCSGKRRMRSRSRFSPQNSRK